MMLVSAVNAGTQIDDRRADAGQEGPRPGASGQSAARLNAKNGASSGVCGPAPLPTVISSLYNGSWKTESYPRPIETIVTPPTLSAPKLHRSGRSGAGAQGTLRAQHRLPARFLPQARRRRPGQRPLSRLLSRARRFDLLLRPGRHARLLRPCAVARPVCDDDHPAGSVRKLPARPARAAHPQSWRAGHGVGIGDADPAALRLPRRHLCRSVRRRQHQAAAARRVRRARPQRHRRPHRQRHLRGDPRRAAAAGAVHRAAHRLFAAPAVALHGDQPAPFPELRAVHQLPVLHRRVLRSCARA